MAQPILSQTLMPSQKSMFFSDLEAATEIDARVTDHDVPDCSHSTDLKDIVDGMITPTPSVSLGRFPTSRLTRQVKPKLTEDIDIGTVNLDTVDAVRDNSFIRVGRKGDETEAIPGLLGTGKWRRLKGGITMDS